MERSQLEHLIAVVDNGGFNRAARALRLSQPALSKSIKSLERELGIQLFQRTSSGAHVTAGGRDITKRARHIIQDIEALTRSANGGMDTFTGTAYVALTPAAAIEPVPAIVQSLQQEHPMVLFEGIAMPSTQAAIESLIHGETQIAIFGEVKTPDIPGIDFRVIAHQKVIIVVPPDSPLSGRKSVTVRDLSSQRFILPPRGTTVRTLFDGFAHEIGSHTITAVASHREAQLPMVKRGLGITLVSSGWSGMVDALGLRWLQLDPPVNVPIWLGCTRSRTSAADEFVNHALRYSHR